MSREYFFKMIITSGVCEYTESKMRIENALIDLYMVS